VPTDWLGGLAAGRDEWLAAGLAAGLPAGLADGFGVRPCVVSVMPADHTRVWYGRLVHMYDAHMTESARQRLLDALVTVIAERGLDQASIREVAAAAGVSIGTVQYYCRSKDEMLRTAFEYVTGHILDRAAGTERTGTVASVLRGALLEFLPLDDTRRLEAKVYLAFAARAAVSPDLASVQQGMMTELRGRCADAFRLAQSRGEAADDLDPEQAAVATAALVDGLLLHLLTDPTGLGPEAAVAVLDTHLARHLDVRAAHRSARP